MKFDFNKILIIFLLLTTIGFGLNFFFSNNETSKEKIKQLEDEYKKLEIEKKEADAKILVWQDKFNVADKKDKLLTKEIEKSKVEAKLAEEKAKKSKVDLDNILINISKNRKEIENLKKNPPLLSDEQLLEELIKKTN